MATDSSPQIPVLTDVIVPDDIQGAGTEPDLAGAIVIISSDLAATVPTDSESLIAELQTELASRTFELTEKIMRTAFSEMEATIYEQISGRLRRELPELIDTLLRERLEREPDDQG